jgi:putative SOS response-associated peptidase YedK
MATRGPRYALTASPDEVQALFRYRDEVDFPPRYNIAPPQPIAVVNRFAGERRFTLMRWGFVPAWVKDPGMISLLAGARAETLRERPAFAAAYRYRRCLMPASGFYLWQHRRGGKSRAFFASAVTPGPIALAGLWETWSGADGSEVDTACLLTIAADPAVAPISARTPVVIAPTDFQEWLSSSDSVEALLRPPRADLFSVQPVSAMADSVRNDSPDLVNPIEA